MAGLRCRWTADLRAVLHEESRRVHAVSDGAANDGEQVEDNGRLIWVLEEKLLGDIDDDRERDEDSEENPNLGSRGHLVEVMGHWARHLLEDTHGVARC